MERPSVMMCLIRKAEYTEFFKRVLTCMELPDSRISDGLEEFQDFYKKEDYTIRENSRGDTFFITSKDQMKVIMKQFDTSEGKSIQTLDEEQVVFGEKILERSGLRTITFLADDPEGVTCFIIEKETFHKLISTLEKIRIRYKDEETEQKPINEELKDVQLADITALTTLGTGGFGRVDLVQIAAVPSRSFALKKIKKSRLKRPDQRQCILLEKEIMGELDCNFIVKLYRTFKDGRYVYMLMEPCLGGELWTVLREHHYFSDAATRFYIACVVEALDYLHSRQIAYRDLKLENILLDMNGYLKLADFGIAKKLRPGEELFTTCGTLQYYAPEVILKEGHNNAVDYWALGVCMYELLTGKAPFAGKNPYQIYLKILEGIERIEFPQHVTENAEELIKKLCRQDPEQRIGYKNGRDEIRKHTWFNGFSWEDLMHRTLIPPIIPRVCSVTDTRNFDGFPPEFEEDVPEDQTEWDIDF